MKDQEWIPVTKRLPECTDGPHSDYCHIKGPEGQTEAYYRKHEPYLWRRRTGDLITVTHWRPIIREEDK